VFEEVLPARMRAAVYRGRPELAVEDVEVPAILPGEILVKVEACGVCGTDLKKIAHALVEPPRIFGHETAGTVAAVGPGVTRWKVGDRVAVNHHVPCMRPECYYCRRKVYAQCPVYKKTGATAGFSPAGGGFAQYVRVMDWCADHGTIAIPDEISCEEAAFIEPLNTVLKGVAQAGIQPGDTVVVVGQGPIGLLFTMVCSGLGAHVIGSDLMPYRRQKALDSGAAAAVDPSSPAGRAEMNAEILRLSDGRGADTAIIAVPSAAIIADSMDLLRPGGSVLLFAHTRLDDTTKVDAGAVCMLEKRLIGSYSSDIDLQDEAANLIFSRKVDVRSLITDRVPLDDIQHAIDVAGRPRDTSLKVMVIP
jgi:L-iditol 2-dehydrogenase